MTVDQSQIPELFKIHTALFDIHPNGKVVVAGHRVPVFVVMEAIKEVGETPDRLAELGSRFTSLNERQLKKLVEFLDEHQEQLAAFYQSEKAISEATFEQIAKTRTGPSLEELRERRRNRQNSSDD